jgi:uncharacterized protein YqhQ
MADSTRERLRLGGMALQNGLFVHGPHFWAAAVRTADGVIKVADGEKAVASSGSPAARIPLARGVLRMAEMLALLPQVRRALPDARLPFENPALAAATMLGALATSGVRRSRLSPMASEAVAAGIALAPALVALRSPSLTRYHGAEHKSIGAYETGGDPAAAPKEHERCGSHLVGPLLGTSAVANVLAARVPKEQRNLARLAASLASLGTAVEIFAWMDRNRDHPASRALKVPGFALQRFLGTREPGAGELEVAQAALDRLLELEERRLVDVPAS